MTLYGAITMTSEILEFSCSCVDEHCLLIGCC